MAAGARRFEAADCMFEVPRPEPARNASQSTCSKMLCELPFANLSAGQKTLLDNSGEAKKIGSVLRLKLGGRHLLLGENGCGKTTLLRAIHAHQIPGWPQGISTCLVEQSLLQSHGGFIAAVPQPAEPAASGRQDLSSTASTTVLEFLLQADVARNQQLARIAHLEAMLAMESLTQAAAGEIASELGEQWEVMEDEGQRRLRATRILTNLGFAEQAPLCGDHTSTDGHIFVSSTATPVVQLSGGWKAKLALASALFGDPQVLLLDEPTNHLDRGAIRWLEGFLVEKYNPVTKRTLLCVSHDRAFLNHVVTDLVVMHNRVLRFFHGDFDHFEEAAAQLEMRLEKAREKNEHMQKLREKAITVKQELDAKQKSRHTYLMKDKRKYADAQACLYGGQASRKVTVLREKNQRGGMERNLDGKAFKASRDGTRLLSSDGGVDNSIETIIAAAPLTVLKDPHMALRFPSEALLERGDEVARITDVWFSYGGQNADQFVIAGANLTIGYGDKLALVGDNGSGKTTFLELLRGAGQCAGPYSNGNFGVVQDDFILCPSRGTVTRPAALKWSYVSQQESEALGNSEKFASTTALQYFDSCFASWDIRYKEDIFIDALAAFGIRDGIATKQALPTLSSGQRVRVALARVAVEKPHLLILDEPTNHLDLYSVEALTRGLREFPGAIVVASHNRQLVLDVAHSIMSLEAGKKPEVVANRMPSDAEHTCKSMVPGCIDEHIIESQFEDSLVDEHVLVEPQMPA